MVIRESEGFVLIVMMSVVLTIAASAMVEGRLASIANRALQLLLAPPAVNEEAGPG
jgi:hypothetical protein